MSMAAAGVTKVIEECGELTQILAKKLAYWWTDEHPDGNGSMRERIQNEMGDVLAAIDFAGPKLNLDLDAIEARYTEKLAVFASWEADPNNNDLAIDGKP